MNNHRHRWYMLALLVVVYVFNIIDRHIINILLEPIKNDLQLTDAEAGFLAGFAFAVFYTVMGIPIATLADRYNRAKIIAVCSALWSAMTAMTGMASNFYSIAIARMGVGVGEAGLTPSANSLIGDLFKPNDRGTALGIYYAATAVGAMLAGFAGGYLESIVGWRMTFIVLGVAGLVVTIIFYVAFKEPQRGLLDDDSSVAEKDRYTVLETIRYLWHKKSCRYIFPAFGLISFVGSAINTWTPAFFMRTYDMSLMQMAATVGAVGGIGGGIGMIAGGIIADRMASRDVRNYVNIPAVALLVTMPLFFGVYLASTSWIATTLFLAPIITGAIVIPPVLALIQRLAKNNMRAVAVAFFLLFIHLIGMGFGPPIVGLISDLLQPMYGSNSLRYALLSVLPLNLISVWLFWRAGRFVNSDLDFRPSD